MKRVNLLLASANRRVSSIVEATVRDVCYEQAVVECTTAHGVEDFRRHSGSEWLDLILVEPDSLRPPIKRRSNRPVLEQTAEAIRSLKSQRTTPVLALNVAPEHHTTLLEAGADNAFCYPLNSEVLKAELRRLLRLEEPSEPTPAGGWSLASALLRGLKRFGST